MIHKWKSQKLPSYASLTLVVHNFDWRDFKKKLNLFLKNHFNHVSRSSFEVDFTPLSLIKWSMVILAIWLPIIQMTINCVLKGSMRRSFNSYWRRFSPKKNRRKSRGIVLLFAHINWGILNPIPNIILKKWNF